MKNTGKIFENDWKKSVPDDIYFLRLNDPPASFGQDGSHVRFSLKNPYDLILFDGCLFPMELKSTANTSMSIQQTKADKNKMIKRHQIEGLASASSFSGSFPGFVLNFGKSGNTYYLHIDDYLTFERQAAKKSINEVDVIKFGGIIIDKKLMKTHYKYFIRELLDKIKENKYGI